MRRSRQRSSKPVARDIRIEFPSQGTTYSRDVYGVYEYGEYPSSSVLAGQEKRMFLDSFETLPEAQAKYPTASVHDHSCFTPPSLNHLPDDDGESELPTHFSDTAGDFAIRWPERS